MKTAVLLAVLSTVLQATSWRADLAEARKLQNSGQPGKAESIYQKLVEEAKGLPPAELNSMALELFYAARYREAEVTYGEALAGWAQLGPAGTGDRIITAANLGTLLRAEGRYSDAEALLLDCLRQADKMAGKESLIWARVASGVGALYLVWGDPAKAETFALQAKAVFEHNPAVTQAEQVNNSSILASSYVEEARYDEAEPLLLAVLDHGTPRLVTRTYNELAVVALRRNQLTEAESWAIKALESERGSEGGPLSAAIRNNLAEICLHQERYVEAEGHYREAIAIWEASVGKQHPDTAKAYMNLAAFCHLRGRDSGAEELYRRSIAILEPVLGQDHLLVLVARNELADVLRAEGRYTESERLGSASLAALQKRLSPHDPRVLRALANQVRLLASTRRPKEAAALRDRIEQMSQGIRVQE
jgi:tetratricopeptide (TPR) repeat protein